MRFMSRSVSAVADMKSGALRQQNVPTVGGYSSTGINGQANRISLLKSNCLMNLRVKSYFSYQLSVSPTVLGGLKY